MMGRLANVGIGNEDFSESSRVKRVITNLEERVKNGRNPGVDAVEQKSDERKDRRRLVSIYKEGERRCQTEQIQMR